MIRAPFQFHRPHSIDEAVRLLSQCVQNGEDAKLLAGGQSLLPSMNLGLVAPAHIVSLNHVAGLDAIRRDGETLAIGAGVTHRALAESEVLQTHCPILSETAASIGDVQVRNRGTLGGSIGHFDPAADYPPVLVLLDAAFRIVGPSGERTVAAKDVFVDYMTTSLDADEVLTEIRVPVLSPDTGTAYAKFTRVEGGFCHCRRGRVPSAQPGWDLSVHPGRHLWCSPRPGPFDRYREHADGQGCGRHFY